MTEPLTPPDCDLRGFDFMPLDIARLLDSDLFALATGDEFKAALTLWCKAWLQVPAASLPDDERVLAHLSGAGPRWRKVREMALRGFVKCNDGRLYHAHLAEKALASWGKRKSYKDRSRKGNAARWGSQKDEHDASQEDASAIPEGVLKPPKGEGEGEYTLAKANAAVADDDPAKSLFDRGTRLLVSKGRTETSARSFLAKMQHDFGNPAVLDAIERCRGATDPASAMRAHLGRAKAQTEYLGV